MQLILPARGLASPTGWLSGHFACTGDGRSVRHFLPLTNSELLFTLQTAAIPAALFLNLVSGTFDASALEREACAPFFTDKATRKQIEVGIAPAAKLTYAHPHYRGC